ncbi:MAG: DUF58 domain-containing protein [Planctomycetota bacterium]|nr:DUF58 domain-containing protein [Planctomycetota bacterium]
MADFKYLDFETLGRIKSMQMLAKTVVEGFILGLHRSPYRGFSVEFAEYRQYVPGDDVKHVDWKVFAKSDRYYIKQFEEETNLACNILVDCSPSMNYKGSQSGWTKLEYACRLAACLSYFMIGQRDATGLLVFDHEIRQMLPARGSPAHRQLLLSTLDQVEPGTGDTDIATPMHHLAESLSRRGMVILISDLLDDPLKVMGALQHFRFLGNEVIVFHVLDRDEIEFPFDTLTEFTDSESAEKVLVAPQSVRKLYMQKFDEFFGAYRRGCGDLNVDYKLMNTSMGMELALSEYLYRRGKLY